VRPPPQEELDKYFCLEMSESTLAFSSVDVQHTLPRLNQTKNAIVSAKFDLENNLTFPDVQLL